MSISPLFRWPNSVNHYTTIAAAIAVLMEVGASILIIIGFFTRPVAILFAFYTIGTGIIGHA
ncbi:DoxX family protein, partial [Rouxiella badensis]|uniref:DoxX family protein n=1 Tax=Rouxiella badensis TaxID=1646377 RepID=UPI003C76CA5F